MKKILKAIIFIIIFLLILCFFDKLYNPTGTLKEWYQSNAMIDFYKQPKDTIDILYVGDSSIYAGLSPMEIYNELGVTGYSISNPGQAVWTSYYMIKEALKTQNPKVIFLEIGEFFTKKDEQTELSIRNGIDPLKFSINKLETINDDCYNLSPYDKLGCVFPAIRYHSRWDKINEFDLRKFIEKGELTYKGYLLEKNVKEYNNTSKNGKKKNNKLFADDDADNQKNSIEKEANSDYSKFPDEVTIKLEKIMDFCDKNNCKLVLLSIPTPKTWSKEKSETINKFANEKNLPFIDLNSDENISMDWTQDSQDGGDHLNIYGAEKVGKYISDYILKNLKLESHKGDEKYKMWDFELNEYNKKKNQKKLNS